MRKDYRTSVYRLSKGLVAIAKSDECNSYGPVMMLNPSCSWTIRARIPILAEAQEAKHRARSKAMLNAGEDNFRETGVKAAAPTRGMRSV